MFENDCHFSHLSTLEREMTFQTEMGLYYSYFKEVSEAETFLNGIEFLMNDNRTEFPSVINTLRRFNVYPELVIGGAYRIYTYVSQMLGIRDEVCWIVERGNGMKPVQSCEGMGVPAVFYVSAIFAWNGLVSGLLFLYGYYLTNTVCGGIMCTACFFFNHSECTRVQWTPPLRESFGYPIFLAQMLYTSHVISRPKPSARQKIPIIILNVMFSLTWQFAQFALLTQIIAVMIMFLLKIIHPNTAYNIIHAHVLALILNFVLLFGNVMLISSFYAAFLVASLATLHCHKFIVKITAAKLSTITRCFCVLLEVIIILFVFFVFRFSVKHVFVIQDDDHIFDILKSKFTAYRDFHTLLYTCAAEFDFLPLETVQGLCHTLLIPSAVLASLAVTWALTKHLIRRESNFRYKACVYNLLQLCAFTIMAAMIMRLKLFLTPHLCILASLITRETLFRFLRSYQHFALVVLIFSGMTLQGLQNIKAQQNIVGEYSNPALEEVMEWIGSETPKSSVFAGPMSTMANIMLSTRRAIVNHPHYENAELRERTKKIYSIYSRQSEASVRRNLKSLKVTHVVVGKLWCSYNHPGCAIVSIWDAIDPGNRNNQPVCEILQQRPTYMKKVFENEVYVILEV